MRAAAAWPLDDCLISEGWASGGRFTVLWVRRHPDRPLYAVAELRADLSGGGIERAIGHTDLGRAAAWTAIEAAGGSSRLRRCDPALAAKWLYAAVERAPAGCGDPDWGWVSELLGEVDPRSCAVPLPPPSAGPRRGPGPGRPALADRMRRTGLAMFSPVAAGDC